MKSMTKAELKDAVRIYVQTIVGGETSWTRIGRHDLRYRLGEFGSDTVFDAEKRFFTTDSFELYIK